MKTPTRSIAIAVVATVVVGGATACGLLDAIFWHATLSNDDICKQINALSTQEANCRHTTPTPSCGGASDVDCIRNNAASGCKNGELDSLFDCMFRTHQCNELPLVSGGGEGEGEGEGASSGGGTNAGFCASEFAAVTTCANLQNGCGNNGTGGPCPTNETACGPANQCCAPGQQCVNNQCSGTTSSCATTNCGVGSQCVDGASGPQCLPVSCVAQCPSCTDISCCTACQSQCTGPCTGDASGNCNVGDAACCAVCSSACGHGEPCTDPHVAGCPECTGTSSGTCGNTICEPGEPACNDCTDTADNGGCNADGSCQPNETYRCGDCLESPSSQLHTKTCNGGAGSCDGTSVCADPNTNFLCAGGGSPACNQTAPSTPVCWPGCDRTSHCPSDPDRGLGCLPLGPGAPFPGVCFPGNCKASAATSCNPGAVCVDGISLKTNIVEAGAPDDGFCLKQCHPAQCLAAACDCPNPSNSRCAPVGDTNKIVDWGCVPPGSVPTGSSCVNETECGPNAMCLLGVCTAVQSCSSDTDCTNGELPHCSLNFGVCEPPASP